MLKGFNFAVFDVFARYAKNMGVAGPWYVSPDFTDDNDSPVVSIGTHEGNHYEETIAQFFGTEFNHRGNAEFVAFCATHADEMIGEITKMRNALEAVNDAQTIYKVRDALDQYRAEKAFKVIKPDTFDQTSPGGNTRIFLGGSIDNGAAEEWQVKVEEMMAEYAVTLYNPRRDAWNPEMKQDISNPEFAYQVNWELDNIEAADTVFFYFSPGGPAPITLMELGAARDQKVVVCCPKGYWRRGNVQVFCQRKGFELFDDLPRAVSYLKSITPK